MIEFFLAIGTGNGPPTFPDSGPGPKTLLRGNEDAGYFGTVSEAEFYDMYDLAAVLPLSATLYAYDPAFGYHWLKFMFKGKVLFIPSNPLYNQASWNIVYNAGYMYGTGDTGKYPTSTPTIQEKRLAKYSPGEAKTYAYSVRSMTGAQNDPQLDVTMGALGVNEYDSLFNLIPGMPNGLIASNYKLNANQITLNTANPNTLFIARSTNGTTGTSTVSSIMKTAATMWWRPVLELIPPGSVVFGPTNLYSIFDLQKPPFDVSAIPVDVAVPPTNVWGTQAGMKPPQLLTVTSV